MNKFFLFLASVVFLLFVSCASTEKPKSSGIGRETAANQKAEEVTDANDDEYTRSTNQVAVSKAQFTSDKKEILQIIAELKSIMAEGNYAAWLKYIDKESVAYWSDIRNLNAASRRLPKDPLNPTKTTRLNNLNDYFKLVFVRSRVGRNVEEIRYISKDSVKAVQIDRKENKDIVYYNFIRKDGKWLVTIPPLTTTSR